MTSGDDLGPLFAPLTRRAHARRTDPDTSHEAARSVEPDLTVRQEAVLLLFQRYGSMTDRELVDRYEATTFLPLNGDPDLPVQGPSGIRTRRHELVVAGRLEADEKVRIGARFHWRWRLRA